VVCPILTTDRLLLRPFTMDDCDALTPLQAEESFWHYPMRRGFTAEETASFLARTIDRYDDPGLAMCAVVVRETGHLAGWAGLAVPTFLPEILPAVEVGWRLGESFRGMGYATEAGRRWVDYGFEELGLDRIVSIYEPENVTSGAVMDRLGFSLERETVDPERGFPLQVRELTRTTWLATPR
jgi:RimJ/RimL family protein N-acetyltransferase